MKNQREMMTALLSGETLVGIDDRYSNEYWLDPKDGRIYYRNVKEDTLPCKCNGLPNFDELQAKPKTITINGFEVPEPMREPGEAGTEYWVPVLSRIDGLTETFRWGIFDTLSKKQLKAGLAHKTEAAAVQHALALLSFTKQD